MCVCVTFVSKRKKRREILIAYQHKEPKITSLAKLNVNSFFFLLNSNKFYLINEETTRFIALLLIDLNINICIFQNN